jgi:hypothetical protein
LPIVHIKCVFFPAAPSISAYCGGTISGGIAEIAELTDIPSFPGPIIPAVSKVISLSLTPRQHDSIPSFGRSGFSEFGFITLYTFGIHAPIRWTTITEFSRF